MIDSPLFARSRALCRLAAAIAPAALLPALAFAAPVWQQTTDLSSTLGGAYTYSSDAGTRTAVTTYANQTATNTGSTAEHMGMYFGWNWSYDSAGADTPLLWSNALQAFVGNGISMTIERVGYAEQSLHLGEIVDDTWIGVGWDPGNGETPIATEASWVAPLFDFGILAAGASASYDIRITMTFDTQGAFDDWNAGGDFYVGAEGVQALDAVPEPASIALVGVALLGLAGASRRRNA